MPSCRRDPGGAVPPRVAARPDPQRWGLDELMTLAEASALFWPHGPLTTRSLRTAADGGLLPVVLVARKRLTSRRAVEEMSRCAPRTPATAPTRPRPPPASPDAEAPVSAYERLMLKLRDPPR